MDLLPPDGTADYLDTGVWSEKAIKEAQKVGAVHVAASSKATNHDRIPGQGEVRFSERPAYVHMTSNNTIFGTQYHFVPEVPAGVPLVNDASSDVFCRPVDFSKFALTYAGAQKNLSIAGLTVVVIREDLLERAPAGLPTVPNWDGVPIQEPIYGQVMTKPPQFVPGGTGGTAHTPGTTKAVFLEGQTSRTLGPRKAIPQTGTTGTQGLIQQGPGEFKESEGYQWTLGQGLQAQQRQASATGRLGSGAYLKDATKYAEGLASTVYQNFLNRYYQSLEPYFTMMTGGTRAAATTAQTGTNTANAL